MYSESVTIPETKFQWENICFDKSVFMLHNVFRQYCYCVRRT
jgi:hypothetical protein